MSQFEVSEFSILMSRLSLIRPGEEVVYHRGFLMRDRQIRKAPEAAASLAWTLYRNGRVILTQRRIGDQTFHYLAIGRRY